MGEQFTSGPWKFKQASGKMHATLMADGSMLAIFRRPVSDADGQLIASCPDLVEALKFAISWIEALPEKNASHQLRDDHLSNLKDALSRATGEG